ncbi:MAG TPA: DMT family transporter [Acidimicrobiia bacterium]|jgi:drug/metabolite transporter (DMT)-like permease
MTRRGWLLFAAMSVIWGVPYLLIKVAVDHVAPPVVVFGRTSLAAVVLLAIAARARQLRPALRFWPWVLAFAAIEMTGPWLLVTNAEQRLPSGLTGLLVACVPIAGAVVAFALGDRHALRPVRLCGIAVGLGGVALLVGRDLDGAHGIPWGSVAAVMLVCVGYASAPFIVARRLGDVPSLGVVALAVASVAVETAPFAWVDRPAHVPAATAIWAIVGLAVLCTGIAFVTFFALIGEVGPTRATLITFANPAVAVVLGAIALNEHITLATLGGFVLVLSGCFLATRTTSIAPTAPAAASASVAASGAAREQAQSLPSSVGNKSAAAASAVARPADFS